MSDKLAQIAKLKSEIDKENSRILSARRLKLDKEIDANEYRKSKTSRKGIVKLERKIEEMSTLDSDCKEKLVFEEN